DAGAVDQRQLIADCERVLVAVRGRDKPEPLAPQIATASFSPRLNEDISPLDEELALPGGGLPTELTRVPTLPPEEQAQPRALPVTEEPELAPIVPRGEEPRRFFPDTTSVEPAPSETPSTDPLRHIHRLVSSDQQERDDAEAALRAMGFGE